MDNTLFLIDGHSLIYKMYYAFLRHPMINSKGGDMSILFGFTKYLLEMLQKEQPSHIAVTFDPPGGTFRRRLYPAYKTNRPATPQLVIDALAPLIELCEALNIKVLMVPDFEADDVIGTAATMARSHGLITYMVTPDKDCGQIVTDGILQYKPGKSGGENEILGPAEICAKYGINAPAQVVDILTLCGDASDNVPGVKGVGEVGAGKLISKYGSALAVYAHFDELPPRQREAFEAARDHIKLSHELVTIRTDVPLEIDFDTLKVDNQYSPRLYDLFEKYEFTSLKKYISHIKPSAKQEKSGSQIRLEVSEVDPARAVAMAKEAGRCSIIIDAENKTIFAAINRIHVGIVSGIGAGISSCGASSDFKELLEDASVEKTGYELKRQRNLLRTCGITLRGRLLDIELLHYLIAPEENHSLEVLSMRYLGLSVNDEGHIRPPRELSLFDEFEEQAQPSRAWEAVVTAMLGDKVEKEFYSVGPAMLYDRIEEPLLSVLGDMEYDGVVVDLNSLRQYATSLSAEMETIAGNIREMAGEPDLNIMSPKQIGVVIYEKLALNPKVKKASSDKRYTYPTDEDTLVALASKHPIIDEILKYRGIRKLISTYIDPYYSLVSPRTGKIHTSFNQTIASTGRLSSSKPNLQNIPVRTDQGREIRRAFVPSSRNGVILSADYSQIELRIMAHLSGDEHLISAFRDGLDVHRITAAKVFGIDPEDVSDDQRRIAKTANFGIMYGISAFGLAQRLKISRADAKKIIDDYFANFSSVSAFIDRTIASARENGYVETIFGRRRYLPEINAKNATARSFAERNAVNAPIQGTSADIIKMAMISISRRISEAGFRSRMVLQVHDELVFDALMDEVDALRDIVVPEMENVVQLSIPLTVDCNYGKNWLEAH